MSENKFQLIVEPYKSEEVDITQFLTAVGTGKIFRLEAKRGANGLSEGLSLVKDQSGRVYMHEAPQDDKVKVVALAEAEKTRYIQE